MGKRKLLSAITAVLFLFQLIFGVGFAGKVKAEAASSSLPTFMDVRKETLGFAYQYKNKTIVNNTVIVDNNIKFFVEENGQKHIISQDFNLIRHLIYIGVYNDNVYVASNGDDQSQPYAIYKANLNTYKMEFVKNVPIYGDGKAYITDYKIDANGVFWFAADQNNIPIYDANGKITDYNTKYIIYNDKGFSHEELVLQKGDSLYNTYGRLQQGLDGSMWFFKSLALGADNKVFRILNDNTIKEYSINSTNHIKAIYPGTNNTLLVYTQEISPVNYAVVKNIIQKYTISNNGLSLVKEYDLSAKQFFESGDINGNMWIDTDGVISKLEDQGFVDKYIVSSGMLGLNVYDDQHLVTCGIVGFGYTPISIDQPSSAAPAAPASENFTTTLNGKDALITLNSSKISKDAVNDITPVIPTDVKTVEAKIDAASINGGKGSIKLNSNNVIVGLPFSTIDFNGIGQGDYVNLKQNLVVGDAVLNSLKSVGKVFDFSLSAYKQDGTKIKDIHTFKSGKANISVKLSKDEISGLDITKLAAFYYNENTKQWEKVGGSYNKDTMTFTFDTSHFSKYTIAEANGMLPQTGSVINFNNLMLLAFAFILIGGFMFFRKDKAVKAGN
ncbi:LPXTG cell wall anchor domain-containing protein [Candidatus Clostridium radicumherbarum]|uniref:LPXTG cell wall anchor domain-containing protein n=1 Tax=Candidatus Clostridium radicumherbarum TaxID=3381662 RepID=A0ABW8TMI6_9CLOT